MGLYFEKYFDDLKRHDLAPARVAEEFKSLSCADCLKERISQKSPARCSRPPTEENLPAVGDWVAILTRPGEARARQYILPRKTKLARKQPAANTANRL